MEIKKNLYMITTYMHDGTVEKQQDTSWMNIEAFENNIRTVLENEPELGNKVFKMVIEEL